MALATKFLAISLVIAGLRKASVNPHGFFSVTPEGQLRWRHPEILDRDPQDHFIVFSEGQAYLAARIHPDPGMWLIAFRMSDGALLWRRDADRTIQPLIGPGGRIYTSWLFGVWYSLVYEPNGDLVRQDEIDLGRRKIASRAYCALFNFRGPDQQKKVGQLSGGERNRVHLAKMLKEGANLLLLDEPTNDLDVDTLRALEEALLEYAGCAVIITHDRWFLDRIATHILAFEGDSQVEWFEGNYADYEADRKRRLGAVADQPHRIKYKPLVRA